MGNILFEAQISMILFQECSRNLPQSSDLSENLELYSSQIVLSAIHYHWIILQ
jgi:hypothetical protein